MSFSSGAAPPLPSVCLLLVYGVAYCCAFVVRIVTGSRTSDYARPPLRASGLVRAPHAERPRATRSPRIPTRSKSGEWSTGGWGGRWRPTVPSARTHGTAPSREQAADGGACGHPRAARRSTGHVWTGAIRFACRTSSHHKWRPRCVLAVFRKGKSVGFRGL